MMCSIYITCVNRKEAETIARHLLDQRLIACANLFPLESLYWWEDNIRNDVEVGIIAKTTISKCNAIVAAVKERHSYDIPCIVAWPIVFSSSDYSRWVTNALIFPSKSTGNTKQRRKNRTPGGKKRKR